MAVRDGLVCLAMVGKVLVVKGVRIVVSSRHGSSSRAGVRATLSLSLVRYWGFGCRTCFVCHCVLLCHGSDLLSQEARCDWPPPSRPTSACIAW